MLPAIRFRAIERDALRQKINIDQSTVSPLTLFLAPAGYGKSIAVLTWLETSAIPDERVFWMQVRPDWDSPQEMFWRCLHECVTGKDHTEIGTMSTRAVRQDLERALRAIDSTAVLVIDSYERVTSPEFDLEVAALAELSRHLFIGVISRRFASLDGPMVTSRIGTTTIGVDDLTFTRDEVERLSWLYGVDEPETIDEIHSATGGWAFAVQGALAEMDRLGTQRYTPVTGRFAQEAIQAIEDPNAVQALLAASLCENITIEMVSGLTELSIRESAAVMKDLEDLGLISRTWYPERVRYKCHPALASTLHERAIEEFGEQRATYLRRSHALGLTSDDPEASLRGLLEIGDMESAERVMIWNFAELVQPGTGVLDVLRTLHVDDTDGYFGLISARCYLELHDPTAPVRRLESWRQRMQVATRDRLLTGDIEHRIAALAILMSAERLGGDGAESYRLARDLEKRLSDTSDRNLSSVRRSLPLLYSVLAFTGLMNGDFEMSYRNYEHAFNVAESEDLDNYMVSTLNGLAFTAAVAGDYPLTSRYLERRAAQERRSGKQRVADLSDLYVTVAMSLMASNHGDGERARSLLREVEPVVNRMDHLALYFFAESIAVRTQDGNREALLTLQRRNATTTAAFQMVPYQRCLLAAHIATLHMLMGDFTAAEEQLGRLPSGHPDVMMAQTRLKVLMGEYHDAVRDADHARTARLTPRHEIEAHLISAVANWELGSIAEAFRALRRGAALIWSTGGGVWALSTVPYSSLTELVRAARDAGEVDLVAEVDAVPETLRCLQFEQLTRAEMKVLRALAAKDSLRQASEQLYISQNTLKTHLRSVYRKLRVLNRHEAVQRGRQIGLID